MMKIGNILLWLTTWMSRLDRMMSPDRCCTNPFLATFLLYVFVVMGVTRDVSSDMIKSLDDVYVLMLPDDKGMGLMCLIFLAAETIMLYGGFIDMLTRYVVIVAVANIFYAIGLFMPLVAPVLLFIVAMAYAYTLIIVAIGIFHRIRHDDRQFPDAAEF